jgi:putative membrane protein
VSVVAHVLVGVVAALHLYFLVLEMFLWTRGAYGAATVSTRILLVQALPAALALAAVLVAS